MCHFYPFYISPRLNIPDDKNSGQQEKTCYDESSQEK